MTNWQMFFYLVGAMAVVNYAMKLLGIPSLMWSTKRGFYWE